MAKKLVNKLIKFSTLINFKRNKFQCTCRHLPLGLEKEWAYTEQIIYLPTLVKVLLSILTQLLEIEIYYNQAITSQTFLRNMCRSFPLIFIANCSLRIQQKHKIQIDDKYLCLLGFLKTGLFKSCFVLQSCQYKSKCCSLFCPPSPLFFILFSLLHYSEPSQGHKSTDSALLHEECSSFDRPPFKKFRYTQLDVSSINHLPQ